MIRLIKNNEIMLLVDFLYEAIFQVDTEKPVKRTIIQEPSLWKYIDNFSSKKDDHCLVAEVDGKIVGAVWVRCIKGFGHVEDTIPELSMSIYSEFRGKGIGKELLIAMLSYLKEKRYMKVSLSVQKNNYAARMYLQAGFEIHVENEQDYIMVYNLDN